MTTERKFCRFSSTAAVASGRVDDPPFGMKSPPDGGMCLSAFLVISEEENPNAILMGHLNESAAWDHIGALDESRVRAHSKGWMLPSSHLIVHESPQEAARRILKEQLNLPTLEVSEPKVVSEVYRPKRFQDLPDHWDIEFIFFGNLPQEKLRKPFAWADLKFVDIPNTKREEIARSHDEILESLGFKIG
ncbi:MAG: NUDIX domain-containing protein [Nitrososphaerota archaeon]|nr:NUDIX domain-containing protein [Nitrososphaerota archaeon]